MKLGSLTPLLIGVLLLFGCGGSSSTPASTPTSFSKQTYPVVGTYATGGNVVPVTVNGNLCGSAASQYPNEICTSVTICSPSNSAQCQTISNVLVDTGSIGLRLFSSVISVSLSPVTNGSMSLAECVQYGDGSSQWGPVEYAYVKLGSEPAVAMPIMVINQSYGTPPAACTAAQSTPDTSPADAGFNGIIGVGLFAQDCGAECVSDFGNQQYYTCSGSDCSSGAKVDLDTQVQHPVSLVPTDNNGVILKLPAVSNVNGVASLSGSLVLGIGTQTNNTPSGVTTYPTDSNGNFSTTFAAYRASAMTDSFIDSGSSALFFPSPTNGSLPDCGTTEADEKGLYCPTSVQSFSATAAGASGSPSGNVSFQVANANQLLASSNSANQVFSDFASSLAGGSTPYFDWGLPFFYGRNVYVGIDGTTSSLGTGPYWSY